MLLAGCYCEPDAGPLADVLGRAIKCCSPYVQYTCMFVRVAFLISALGFPVGKGRWAVGNGRWVLGGKAQRQLPQTETNVWGGTELN